MASPREGCRANIATEPPAAAAQAAHGDLSALKLRGMNSMRAAMRTSGDAHALDANERRCERAAAQAHPLAEANTGVSVRMANGIDAFGARELERGVRD